MLVQDQLTVLGRLKTTAAQLKDSGIPNARYEAEILLKDILGKSRTELFLDPKGEWSPEAEEQLAVKLAARKQGTPLAYLTGKAYFRYLELEVGPGVLIPRPETELLVEEVIRWSEVRCQQSDDRREKHDPRSTIHDPRILDVGTGSGAIALSLLYEMPGVEVTAVDISAVALEITLENARKHGLLLRLKTVRSDLFDGLGSKYYRHFDVIVSNPPYIRSGDIAGLQREVKDYEPLEALDGGQDGLDLYRRMLSQAHLFLRPGALLALEAGYGQAEAICRLINQSAHYTAVTVIPDHAGIDRIIMAEKSPDV